jgi:hypothetical protein
MKLVFLVVLPLFLFSCSPVQYSSIVKFENKESVGSYILSATGFSKKSTEAIIDAEKNAFKVLLFKGLPGTDLSVPLIESQSTAEAEHKNYLDRLFNEGGYAAFIMNRNTSFPIKKIKGGYETSVILKINIQALRKDLEQNKVIRKFGYK